MKITALEIRQHEFEKTFRGYNIEEVDNFLSNLAQEWERILNDSKMLRMQLEIAEKEANKLREIEMTLFKTLKTAEDTSTMITEQASQQAEKNISEAKLKGEDIIQTAQAKAAAIIRQAEDRANYVKEEVLGEVKGLERDFRAMDQYKNNLMVQMRSLANATIDHVDRFENKFDKEGIDAKFKEATTMLETEEDMPLEVVNSTVEAEVPQVEALAEEINENVEETTAQTTESVENAVAEVSESVEQTVEKTVSEPITEAVESVEAVAENTVERVNETVESIVEVPTASVEEVVTVSSVNSFVAPPTETPKFDDLEIIEGIGPKIAELLRDSGILTFADLAKTPSFKIKEILIEAGPQFARHDPSTWTEQALLAATGRFEELEVLKEKLYGGRHVEEETVSETIEEVKTPEVVAPAVEYVAPVAEVVAPVIEVTPPVFEVAAPVVEAVAPVNAVAASVVEAVAPVNAVVAPVVEAVAPVVEVTAPVVEVVAPVIEVTTPVVQVVAPVVEVAAPVVEAISPVVEAPAEAITEDMLEKVNKVKAAIRKAMAEKAENQARDNTPLTTVNDVMAKNEGGSFFDNI